VESACPGELLCADTFFAGNLKGIGKAYLHAVVDSYSSYAFGFLHVSKQPDAAVAVLHNDVLPFYEKFDLPVKAVLTDNGREFCGRPDQHPYELFLQLEDIEHRTTRVKRPQSNGIVERFHRTLLDEHFRVEGRRTWFETIEEMQTVLDDYLVGYNRRRPHQGRGMNGRTPATAFLEGLPKPQPQREEKRAEKRPTKKAA
jgi:transposase InsO family protein